MVAQYTDKSFQGFFTNADDIRHTMIELLGDVTNQEIIEPCFGEGAFIKNLIGHPKKIDAIDIDGNHFKNKPDVNNCNYYNLDYLNYFVNPDNRVLTLPETKYDSTICNPPYGLKFSKEYRKLIKKKFPDVYARESYGLFFYLTIKQLNENGRYVFIMPDTFFTSRNLGYLRKYIVNSAQPTHIIQFKSKRFGSVNFGYGNLCIIAGTKKAISPSNKTNWIDAVSSDDSLLDLLKADNTTVNGQYFIDHADDAWISPKISNTVTFSREVVNLSEIAECKTGIYTGDNTRFCGFNEQSPPKRINGHPVDWDFVVHSPSDEEKKLGIKNDKAYVPFIRGGHRQVFEKTNSCICWDVDAINFYRTDKKARLQNKDFYFKTGLAVPMVTSGKISASEMKNSIFDQGVVGIFAYDDNYHNFLLLYLNDDFAYKLKALISPGANNSANYLKKMPVPKLTNLELDEATNLVNLSKDIGWANTKETRERFIASVI